MRSFEKSGQAIVWDSSSLRRKMGNFYCALEGAFSQCAEAKVDVLGIHMYKMETEAALHFFACMKLQLRY